MSEPSNRYLALELATRHSAATSNGQSLTDLAKAYLDFLEGNAAQTGSGETGSATPSADKPKRQRKAAEQPKEEPKQQASDDLGLDDEPKDETANGGDDWDAGEPTPSKEEKITLEMVRAALVELQTVKKTKDAPVAVIKQFTTDKSGVLSKIPEAKYAEVIAAAKKAAK